MLSTLLRRYGLPSLLFALCLGVVLWSKLPAVGQTAIPDTVIAQTRPQNSPLPKPQLSAAPSDALTATVRKTVLDNGLTVLTKEVKTAPVVTVQVWYRVGSRNETPGSAVLLIN
jgi:zinc protease